MKNKNIQRIVKYMEANPLNAAFVATAMSLYVGRVTENRENTLKLMKETLIDGEAWIRCADDWSALNR